MPLFPPTTAIPSLFPSALRWKDSFINEGLHFFHIFYFIFQLCNRSQSSFASQDFFYFSFYRCTDSSDSHSHLNLSSCVSSPIRRLFVFRCTLGGRCLSHLLDLSCRGTCYQPFCLSFYLFSSLIPFFLFLFPSPYYLYSPSSLYSLYSLFLPAFSKINLGLQAKN